MSVKKQFPSLFKLHSFWKETPHVSPDDTDVESFFYHNVFDISQSRNRIVSVSKASNKMSLAIGLLQSCNLKTQQRYILQEVVKISERKLISLVDSLRDFLKTFDEVSKCLQFHDRN